MMYKWWRYREINYLILVADHTWTSKNVTYEHIKYNITPTLIKVFESWTRTHHYILHITFPTSYNWKFNVEMWFKRIMKYIWSNAVMIPNLNIILWKISLQFIRNILYIITNNIHMSPYAVTQYSFSYYIIEWLICL